MNGWVLAIYLTFWAVIIGCWISIGWNIRRIHKANEVIQWYRRAPLGAQKPKAVLAFERKWGDR